MLSRLRNIASSRSSIMVKTSIFVPRALSTAVPSSRKVKKVEPEVRYIFSDEIVKLIAHVKEATEHMQELNEIFNITSAPDNLIIDIGEKGKYVLSTDYELQRLYFSSPVSGQIQYYFDPDSQNWLSDRDDHDFRGLMTRDMLRHLVGCPTF